MRSAVMVGAGKIGRAFLARLLRAGGYSVIFIDKDRAVIESLRKHPDYPVTVVRPDSLSVEIVDGYGAHHISETSAVEAAVRGASLVAVSVGVENVPDVAETLAPALAARLRDDSSPLNILVCENMISSNKALADAVRALLPPELLAKEREHVGYNSVCVGCTVPLPPQRLTSAHPLALVIDAYDELPVDAETIRGTLPQIPGVKVYDRFDYCIRRKLYIHNMGHAVAAYAGRLKGYAQLSDAMEDKQVYALVSGAMLEAACALKSAYPFAQGLEEYMKGLLALFANADMGDTLERIGRDPMRKTSGDDRLAGALRFCFEHGQDAPCIAAGLAAGLCFKEKNDVKSVEMQERIADKGIEDFIRAHCGLTAAQTLPVLSAYRMIRCFIDVKEQ